MSLPDGYYNGVIDFHEYTTLGSDNKDVWVASVILEEGETLETKEPVLGEGQKVNCTFFLDDPTQFFDFLDKTGAVAKTDDLSQLGGEFYDSSPLKGIGVTVRLKSQEKNGKVRQYANLYAKRKEVTTEEKKAVGARVSSKLGQLFAMRKAQANEKAQSSANQEDMPF